jgi:hypothetical protein
MLVTENDEAEPRRRGRARAVAARDDQPEEESA